MKHTSAKEQEEGVTGDLLKGRLEQLVGVTQAVAGDMDGVVFDVEPPSRFKLSVPMTAYVPASRRQAQRVRDGYDRDPLS